MGRDVRQQPAQPPPTLPAWKAFIVQFSADAGMRGSNCSGRVEHLSSGRRVRFNSKEELVEALGQLLDQVDEAKD